MNAADGEHHVSFFHPERVLQHKQLDGGDDILSPVGASPSVSADAASSCASGQAEGISSVVKEVRRVLALAGPASLVDTVSFCASLFSVSQVGMLGYKELSAMTLGNTLFNITGLSVIVGITSGMDTFCGQVYGAGQFGTLGTIWQRAVLLCLVCSIPSFLVWTRAGKILMLLGQAEDVSRMAELYIWAASPCLVLTGIKCCCKSYFSSQGVVVPVTIITFVCTLLVPVYNYILIDVMGLGLLGAAVAFCFEDLTAVVLLAAYMVIQNARLPDGEKTWAGWSWQAFSGWWLYLKVAVPSMAMILLDWWVLEIMILLAGLGKDADIQVAAMGLLFQIFTFVYYVTDGFGTAASTRVSHALGGNSPAAARLASSVCLVLGLAMAVLASTALYCTQHQWITLFSRSQEVRDVIFTTMPYVVAAVCGYSSNTVLSGVLRGANRQTIGFVINLVTLWMVGLPVAAYLCLHLNWGTIGLWCGIALMNILQGAILAVQVARFDWNREVERSRTFVNLCTPMMQSVWNLTSLAGRTTDGGGTDRSGPPSSCPDELDDQAERGGQEWEQLHVVSSEHVDGGDMESGDAVVEAAGTSGSDEGAKESGGDAPGQARLSRLSRTTVATG